MMKSLWTLLAVVGLSFAVAGCGETKAPKSNGKDAPAPKINLGKGSDKPSKLSEAVKAGEAKDAGKSEEAKPEEKKEEPKADAQPEEKKEEPKAAEEKKEEPKAEEKK